MMRFKPMALALVLLFALAAGATTIAAEDPVGTAAMLDIGLGEGSGAALALPLIQGAARVMRETVALE